MKQNELSYVIIAPFALRSLRLYPAKSLDYDPTMMLLIGM